MTILKKRAIHFLITALLICIGTLGYAVLSSQKPQLKRKKPSTPAPMVRWEIVIASNVSVPITGEGTVVPFKEIRLRPQVSGKIIQVSPSFVNGGSYNKGDLLLQIDPTDYELAVTLAESRVKDSESKLKIAEQEAAAAKEEWLLLNKNQSLNDMPPLVAKEPQLKAAQAKLEADLAELQKALLNLERTEIKTPFKGRVSSKSVDVGQYVSTGQNLAVLFSTEIVEIVVHLENETLAWIHVPGFTSGENVGSSADVIAFVAGKELSWKGRIVRSQGKLDPRTRMVPVVIQVNQPYATRPPLAAGLFAKVEIQGRTLENAMIIPRTALRVDDTVWVINDKQVLTFRKVVVAKLFPDKAIITSGLQSGERIATSPLKMVTDGMKIQLESPEGEKAS